MNAIILTGGTSTRFGSDKYKALVAGRSLLEILTSNLPECDLIIVGPSTPISAKYVQEKPILSGPVAAIAAGMDLVTHDTVAIYATDMPFAPLLINELIASLVADGVVPVDKEGIAQPLAGLYRTASLRAALQDFSNVENKSVKSLLSNLKINLLNTKHTDYLLDIDTVNELEIAKVIQGRISK